MELSIALGFNAGVSSLTPLSYWLGYEPNGIGLVRVPRGSVVSRLLSGRLRFDGEVIASTTIPAVFHSKVDEYVEDIFGGWYGNDSAEVTLLWLGQDNEYRLYNAIASRPEVNRDYANRFSNEIENLILSYSIIDELELP